MSKKPQIINGKTRCEECGRWFKRLSLHIVSHGYKADDYRGKYGYELGVNLDGSPINFKKPAPKLKWPFRQKGSSKKSRQEPLGSLEDLEEILDTTF